MFKYLPSRLTDTVLFAPEKQPTKGLAFSSVLPPPGETETETDSRNFQFRFRHYSGSLGEKGRLHSRTGAPYSPIIEVDEDSHSKYVPPGAANIGAAEEMRGGSGRKHGGGGDDDDLGWGSLSPTVFV